MQDGYLVDLVLSQYFIVGKILFLVIELQANFDDLECNVAQLFSELYSKYSFVYWFLAQHALQRLRS